MTTALARLEHWSEPDFPGLVFARRGRFHVALSLSDIASLLRVVQGEQSTGSVTRQHVRLWEDDLVTLRRELDPTLREKCRRDPCTGWVQSPDHDGLCPAHHFNDPNEG